MAGKRQTTKKKTAGRTRSGSSGKRETARRTPPVRERSVIGDEIILCLVIACAILLFISNLGFGGAVGGRISGVLFGLFGAMAYAFPFFLFFAVAFAMANRDSSLLLRKELGLWLIFIFKPCFIVVIFSAFQLFIVSNIVTHHILILMICLGYHITGFSGIVVNIAFAQEFHHFRRWVSILISIVRCTDCHFRLYRL